MSPDIFPCIITQGGQGYVIARFHDGKLLIFHPRPKTGDEQKVAIANGWKGGPCWKEVYKPLDEAKATESK